MNEEYARRLLHSAITSIKSGELKLARQYLERLFLASRDPDRLAAARRARLASGGPGDPDFLAGVVGLVPIHLGLERGRYDPSVVPIRDAAGHGRSLLHGRGFTRRLWRTGVMVRHHLCPGSGHRADHIRPGRL